jgi:hypothetical protein
VGPVDWAHPDIALACERLGVTEATLHQVAENPDGWRASDDGGWPRMWAHPILAFRMYDGWPYWVPRPAFLLRGPLGPEWRWLDSMTELCAPRTGTGRAPAPEEGAGSAAPTREDGP